MKQANCRAEAPPPVRESKIVIPSARRCLSAATSAHPHGHHGGRSVSHRPAGSARRVGGVQVHGGRWCAPSREAYRPRQKQRGCFAVSYLHVPRPAHDDLVIAGREPVLDRALQRGQHAVQPEAAGQPPARAARPPSRPPARGGRSWLTVPPAARQDVDRERAVRPDVRQRLPILNPLARPASGLATLSSQPSAWPKPSCLR